MTCQDAHGDVTRVDRTASPARPGPAEDRVVLSERGEGYVLVEVGGVVDIASRRVLTDVFFEAVDSGEPVVIVDLSAVTLLAAAGIHCLKDATTLLAERDRCLHLVCPAGRPAARMLALLDLHDVWPVHPDTTVALAAVRARSGGRPADHGQGRSEVRIPSGGS